jgi:hypothetical protein
MYQNHAKLALELISKVNIQASDEAIQNVAAVRAMLHGVANGSLTVTAKPPMPTPGEVVPK